MLLPLYSTLTFMITLLFLPTKGEIIVESDSIGTFELHRKALAEDFWTAEA